MSGLAITQEGTEDREYLMQVYYISRESNLSQYEIHVVITWNTKIHRAVIKAYYESINAVLGLEMLVEFSESGTITLDIPFTGITIQGWDIIPIAPPVVTKKQVDCFEPGKRIPCCQLIAEVSGKKKKIPTLRHQVNLKGAKFPNAFVINLPAGELLFHEGALLALPPMKTEPKEEAVTMTKAEATFDQPTTATWNLRGVEVCGEMTVVVYSSHDQQITWPGYGLRLHIPKGCLPAGMEQCTINIKASLAGQYEFPENSHLVSAVFWLRCDEVCEFTRPITVEIQHCAKLQNVTNFMLSFVRAVCSQKQLPYTFKQLLGSNFTSHSSYGVIELKSFSGVGVTQEGSEDREYCSQLFYLGQPDRCRIHYVVTWNIEAHLTVVKEEYLREGAVRDLHQSIEFELDAISLDIPLEGVNIKGWKITPLIRPVVTKKQVDNFREGKMTPCCQLLAEVSGKKKKIPTIKHQVNLKGAKYPNDVFVINLPAGDTNPQERSQIFGDLAKAAAAGPPPIKKGRLQSDESAFPLLTATQSLPTKVVSTDSASSAGPSSTTSRTVAVAHTGLDTKLDLRFNHFQATIYLQSLDERQIRHVGGALGLTYDVLEKMKTLPDDMVAAWLRREDFVISMSGEPTWRTLVEALRKVGQEGTARDIEEAETK